MDDLSTERKLEKKLVTISLKLNTMKVLPGGNNELEKIYMKGGI